VSRENVAAIYARVSTRDQKPENQLLELREFARRQGFEVFREFVDHGESGSNVYDNPKSQHSEMRELARRGKFCPFGVVLVWKFDRFARSARELHNALFEFERAGIRFLSLQEQIDTQSVAGKMLFSVLAGVSEMELGIQRERIFAGLARARKEGKKLGHPPRLTLPQIEAAYEMRRRGESWRTIAKTFGVAKNTARDSVLRWIERKGKK
jgi:DNA invertase Pin-like site-specific DNA recombinase